MDKEDAISLTLPPEAIRAACAAWDVLERALGGVASTHDRQNADKMMAILDALLDSDGAQMPGHAGLLAFVSDWVSNYDASQPAFPELFGVDLLRALMDHNGLKQADIVDFMGGQPNASAVLAGKRAISVKQAQALSDRFAVSMDAFLRTPVEHGPAEVQSNAQPLGIDLTVTHVQKRFSATPASILAAMPLKVIQHESTLTSRH